MFLWQMVMSFAYLHPCRPQNVPSNLAKMKNLYPKGMWFKFEAIAPNGCGFILIFFILWLPIYSWSAFCLLFKTFFRQKIFWMWFSHKFGSIHEALLNSIKNIRTFAEKKVIAGYLGIRSRLRIVTDNLKTELLEQCISINGSCHFVILHENRGIQ